MARDFRVINGCPCPANEAPYVYLILKTARQSANSIYRGDDAASILHRHGKHTQREIYRTSPPGVANPPGLSAHELRSDGHRKGYRRGVRVPDWMIGVDSGSDSKRDRDDVVAAAHKHGLHVYHPYNSGVEGHHWEFSVKPSAKNRLQKLRISAIRARLPRK